jgi:hypothetical protein
MWFSVDKKGLGKILERKGKEYVLYELLQNAWDQHPTSVIVTLESLPGGRRARVRVEDDSVDGFRDLSHAWTLFAESAKKDDPTKRGRFNLGEKLVLALCDEATIVSTRGGVRFDEKGRHTLRERRDRGTVFEAIVRMTIPEVKAAIKAAENLLPPSDIVTTFNGENLSAGEPFAIFDATLQTEVSDEDGYLRRTQRKTQVRAFRPMTGEPGWIYEMGIPVMETGDAWHLDVGQKVPLGLERDAVSPAFVRALRTAALNALHEQVTHSEAGSTWVREALGDSRISTDAVKSVIEARYGDKVVAFDPSDPEANKLAVTKGYRVIPGGSLSADEWANVKKAGAILPAGRVTPSPKPFSPDGKPLKLLSPERWSEQERRFVETTKRICKRLTGVEPAVHIAVNIDWPFAATYGPGILHYNKGRLGAKWFEEMGEKQISLIIHELGHHYSGDHLSEEYHDALTDLGARLTLAVIQDPSLLKL